MFVLASTAVDQEHTSAEHVHVISRDAQYAVERCARIDRYTACSSLGAGDEYGAVCRAGKHYSGLFRVDFLLVQRPGETRNDTKNNWS